MCVQVSEYVKCDTQKNYGIAKVSHLVSHPLQPKAKCIMAVNIRAVFDRKKKSTPTKSAKVEIEISFSRTSRKWISTDISLYSNQWEDGFVVRHPQERKLNKQITDIIKKYQEIVRTLRAEGMEINTTTFTAALDIKRGKYGDTFIDFAYSIMERRGLRPSTIKAHKHTLESLRAFGRIKYFDDLTAQNIALFDRWLREKDPTLTQPSIYNYHKRIKPYINEAIKLGIIEESPYIRFHAEKGKHKPKEALNLEELTRIRELTLTDPGLLKARDLFVFCAYTGLSHADMCNFDFDRHAVIVNGHPYIDGERIKTGTRYYTPILPPAMEVLKKYNNQLPFLTQQAYNRLLKCIAALIGTRKNLSSHIARYTFATTVLLANEVPIESVSKMLGHTRIQITQLYAHILNSSIEKQAERLANIL